MSESQEVTSKDVVNHLMQGTLDFNTLTIEADYEEVKEQSDDE